MISATDEQLVSNSIKGLYSHGTHDRTRDFEHYPAVHEHVAFHAIASLAIERGSKAGDVRLGFSQDESCGRTKPSQSFFSRPSTLSDIRR